MKELYMRIKNWIVLNYYRVFNKQKYSDAQSAKSKHNINNNTIKTIKAEGLGLDKALSSGDMDKALEHLRNIAKS